VTLRLAEVAALWDVNRERVRTQERLRVGDPPGLIDSQLAKRRRVDPGGKAERPVDAERKLLDAAAIHQRVREQAGGMNDQRIVAVDDGSWNIDWPCEPRQRSG